MVKFTDVSMSVLLRQRVSRGYMDYFLVFDGQEVSVSAEAWMTLMRLAEQRALRDATIAPPRPRAGIIWFSVPWLKLVRSALAGEPASAEKVLMTLPVFDDRTREPVDLAEVQQVRMAESQDSLKVTFCLRKEWPAQRRWRIALSDLAATRLDTYEFRFHLEGKS